MRATTEGMTHRLPLRPDFDAEFWLPHDLTQAEAERIAKWLLVLAMPAEKPEGE